MKLNFTGLMRAAAQHVVGKDTTLSGASLLEHLRRRSRSVLPMLGWPGIVAISLFAVFPPFYFSTLRPMQDRLFMSQRIENNLREQSNIGTVSYKGSSTPVEELEQFYKYFPPEKSSPHWLGKLVEIAGRQGLNLNHGEYVVTRDKVGQMTNFRITLPVQGKYTQIRKFLNSVDSEIPNMALENVQFERKDILDTNVQVKVKLLLYMVQDS